MRTAKPTAKAAYSSEIAAESSLYAQLTSGYVTLGTSEEAVLATYTGTSDLYGLGFAAQSLSPSEAAALSAEYASYATASLSPSEAAALSAEYAEITSEAAFFSTYTGTDDPFATATETGTVAANGPVPTTTDTSRAPTSNRNWPALTVAEGPSAYGIECRHFKNPNSTLPSTCTETITGICGLLSAVGAGNTTYHKEKIFVGSWNWWNLWDKTSCAAAVFVPKVAVGPGKFPTIAQCEALIYGKMETSCRAGGFDNARVNLIRGSNNYTDPRTDAQLGPGGTMGSAVDPKAPSYMISWADGVQ